MIGKGENDKPKNGLPSLLGTYAVVLRVSGCPEIAVGKLGVLAAQPGFYVYVGSALGPGGLAARVGTHYRHAKRLRWHVDYLRAVADVEEVWYATGKSHRECRWANALRRLPGASVPLTGFGTSDCGCPSHLCFFTLPPSLAEFRKKLRNQGIERLQVADAQGAMCAVAASAQRSRPDETRR
jgi:Uri superfamily endonuclease